MLESRDRIISFNKFWALRSLQVFNDAMEAKSYKRAVQVAESMIEQKYTFANSCLYEALIELLTQEKSPDELNKISARISALLVITI